ncbi:TetR/AcrR family transcriptional regulator [Streptomyces sp. NPDC051018]|uniref:TetR/AcrR family transcriptional regulator n=1 Tax=Streptomyces sp. NPDC051018 TaxID=3365639 RepID=UPI0037B52132
MVTREERARGRTGGATLGLRERKRRQTHRLLVTTALRLVAERGLDRVTVEDISAEAGVSARTFFNYFTVKEDALLVPYPDDEERMATLPDRIIAAPAGLSPPYAMVHAWRDDLARWDADRDEWLTRITAMTEHPALAARLVRHMAEEKRVTVEALARRTGLPSGDPYLELVFHVVEGAMEASVALWHRLGGETPLPGLVDTAVAAVEAGLPVPDRAARRPGG